LLDPIPLLRSHSVAALREKDEAAALDVIELAWFAGSLVYVRV
jgi:hypothetical protein